MIERDQKKFPRRQKTNLQNDEPSENVTIGAPPSGSGNVTGFDVAGVAVKSWFRGLELLFSLPDSAMKIYNKGVASLIETNRRLFSQPLVDQWVAIDRVSHNVDDGSSPGGRYYKYVKERQSSLEVYFPGLRKVIHHHMKYNEFAANFLRGKEMVEHFGATDEMIRAAYQRIDPDKAKTMRWHGTLFDEKYNHKFLAETSHPGKHEGEIVAMDVDAIVKLFRKRAPRNAKKGEFFPHIIITSSHAQGETLEDVTAITHGIQALARDNNKGQELPHAYPDTGVKPGQTLTLYACDVEETPWKNGKALLERVLELKRVARTGKPESDTFEHISPGAKRIAKLMLKCMIEDPSLIDVDTPDGIAAIAGHRNKAITLRPDAVEIAHHFQLIGFSKGGNVVSDAARYLVSELSAKRADGRSLFEKNPEKRWRPAAGNEVEKNDIRDIVRSISVMALAAIEVKMEDYYKERGVRRVSINNKHDLISAHRNFETSLYDERWLIEGSEEQAGHSASQMMGARALSEEFAERGYAHKDPNVARRLTEFFAANFGKAAISKVHFGKNAAKGEVIVEAATGTTDRQIVEYADTIKTIVANAIYRGERAEAAKREAMSHVSRITKSAKKAFRMMDDITRNITFEPDGDNPGIFKLRCAGADFAGDPGALSFLRRAFQNLRSDDVKGLVITDSIVTKDGDIALQRDAALTAQAELDYQERGYTTAR